MDNQNLIYAVTQIVHNFGAAAVMGSTTAVVLRWCKAEAERKLAWLVLVAWAVQAVSGATFGATSFYYYGRFPEIQDIALAALGVKIASAAVGFVLAARLLFTRLTEASARRSWLALCGLGALALSAAAVLRWFS